MSLFTVHIHCIYPLNNFKYSYLDRDTISRVANALTVESASMAMSISLLKLNSSTDLFERRENIKKSLLTFPNRFIGMDVSD